MGEPSVDPLVPHLFPLSLTPFALPPLGRLRPLHFVFQLDDVDEPLVAVRDVTLVGLA